MRKRIVSGILISAMAALLVAAPAMAGEAGATPAMAGEAGAEEIFVGAEETSVWTEETLAEETLVGAEETFAGTEDALAEESSDFEEVEEDAEEIDYTDGKVGEFSAEESDLTEDLADSGEIQSPGVPVSAESPDGGAGAGGDADGDLGADDAYANGDTSAGGDADANGDAGAAEETDDESENEDDYGIALFDVKQDADTAVVNGFGQDPDTGDWYYYTDGKIDTSKNSVIKDTDKRISGTDDWWYVVGGKVQMDFTGLANYSNASGWWYITNGRVDRSVTTVAKNKNGWYYVKNGKVDKSYTGFATNENGSWYMENGKLLRDQNTVIKDTNGALGSKSEWYYVVGSKVQSDFTGLANYSNASGWWYITNGRVDRTYNGLAKNKNGWYYLTNGKVDRSYTGFAVNENGSWYMTKGKLTRSDNTVLKDTTGVLGAKGEWYYVIGSKVQYSFTGLANYKNASGWWYITNGRVDRTYNGLASNKNGWYYLTNGKVDYSYTGIASDGSGWWYVNGGRRDTSVGDYSFAANTSQIIDVRASGSTGTLTLYNKSGNHFNKVLSTSCYVGRNGITSNKSEGDGKTPAGVYTLGQAFGVASDPGSTRSYLKVNSNYYWVDDSTSKYYNQLVDVSKVSKDWSSAEHLIDYTSAYKYAIAVDYNTACTPYKGSAIFLHCSTGGSTSGCVAVSESYMIQILQSLKSDTRIYIH